MKRLWRVFFSLQALFLVFAVEYGFNGGEGVQARAVEDGQGAVAGVEQQSDFRAAEDDALRALLLQLVHGFLVEGARAFFDAVAAQFFKDDAVDAGLCVVFGGEEVDAVGAHALVVEAVLHGEGGAEQADALQVLHFDGGGGGVDDVQEGDADGGFDGVGDFVHGVGGEQQQVCAAVLQAFAALREALPGLVPVAGVLQGDDVGKVEAVDEDGGAVVAVQARVDGAVDGLVVEHGAFGAHAADDAKCFHVFPFIDGFLSP